MRGRIECNLFHVGELATMSDANAVNRPVGSDRNAIDDPVNRITQKFETRNQRNIEITARELRAER